MAAPSIPPVKRALRTFSLERARRLAAEALAAEDVSEVHHLIDAAFEESGLGGASSAEIEDPLNGGRSRCPELLHAPSSSTGVTAGMSDFSNCLDPRRGQSHAAVHDAMPINSASADGRSPDAPIAVA